MDELFDMHCHLGFFPDVVTAARDLDAAGVGALCATVTPGEYERVAAELAGAPNVRVGVGLHPWWVADGTCGEADVERAASLAATCRYVAEVGLDYARGRDATRDAQLRALDRMLAAYGDGGHMLSVHAVRAASDVLDALERHDTVACGNVAVLHWFSGTSPELTHAIRLGCRFSVGPRMLATRRGREYARQIPPERLLLETDLPASPGQGATLGPGELARELAGHSTPSASCTARRSRTPSPPPADSCSSSRPKGLAASGPHRPPAENPKPPVSSLPHPARPATRRVD